MDPAGDFVAAPNVPGGSRVFVLRDVESAFPYVLVEAVLKAASGPPYMAFLRMDFSGASPVTTVLAREGLAVNGGQGVVGTGFHEAAIADDGTWLTALDQDVAATNDVTIGLRDGLGVYPEGVAAPLGGATWRHAVPPSVAKAPGSSFAFSSTLERASGAIDGIVLANGAIVALEGNALFGAPGLTTVNFQSAALAQARDGMTVYNVPTQVGSVVMAYEPGGAAEVVLQSGVDTVGGVSIASVKPSTRGSVSVTGDGRDVLVEVQLVGGDTALVLVERRIGVSFGCSANPNSTGAPGELEAFGSSFVSVNNLTVEASSLPQGAFGYLGCSTTPAFVPLAGGSSGNLCLGGNVGRFSAQVASSGTAGRIATTVNLSAIPQPTGPVAALAGETWGFQLWHRDVGMGVAPATSNFTQVLRVVLR